MNKNLAVDIKELTLQFGGQTCLDIPSLQIEEGDTVLLFGENGAGKTTLMKILSGLIKPNATHLRVLGQDLATMEPNQLNQFRADNLMPYLNALENILLPCGFSKRKEQIVLRNGMTPEYEAYKLMAQLKLENPERLKSKTDQLSKGLQQRIAVVRALMGNPKLILADEPASAMGSYSQRLVYELLINYAKEHQCTLICISHNKEADPYFNLRLNMKEINKNAETNPLW